MEKALLIDLCSYSNQNCLKTLEANNFANKIDRTL